jgi:predicted nucleic acid-binding protein
MKHYADTGFLLSLHIPETTSPAAASVMQAVQEPIPLSPLIALEFRNALRLAVFRSRLTESERAAAWASFEEDIARGLLRKVDTDFTAVFFQADSLCDQFTAATGVRSLDILHVAHARVLGCAEFFSFDIRQRRLAAMAGLLVVPS